MTYRQKIRSSFIQTVAGVEKVLLLGIALATLVGIGLEVQHVWQAQTISISDILLLFIYLEVLAMSRLYVELGRVPVRYPIYIAVIAMARYLTLAMKELESLGVFWIAMAMLVLVIATLGLRIGHLYFPYPRSRETETETTATSRKPL